MTFEEPIVKVNGVSKIFKNSGIPAVDNISFSVDPGEILGLVGSENSGKTTLLRMITGLTSITSGSIYVDGFDVEREHKKAIENIGAMIDGPAIYPYLTGYENLQLIASYYNNITSDHLNQIVKYVGLEKQIHGKVSSYSLGMKQRLGIVETLINSPKLIILDEPTIGLDPNAVKELRQFLLSYVRKNNIAMIISSRSENDIENLCDTIAVLDKGKMTKLTTSKAVKQKAKNEQEITLFVDYPNFAYKLIETLFRITPTLSQKSLNFKASEEQISGILEKLSKENISVFDMTTKTKKYSV